MKTIIIALLPILCIGCSDNATSQKTFAAHPYVEFVNKVAAIPYRDFRSQDQETLKSLYIDHLKSMEGLHSNDVSKIVSDLPAESLDAYENNIEWMSHASINWTVEERFSLSKMIDSIPHYADARDLNILTNVLVAYSPIQDSVEKLIIENKDLTGLKTQPLTNDLPVSNYVVDRTGLIKIEMKNEFRNSVSIKLRPELQKSGHLSWQCFVNTTENIIPANCIKEKS